MNWKVTTGLDEEQLTELVARVHLALGGWQGRGRPPGLGLFRSVALVLALLRQNVVQQVAAEIFGISQATVSRRWTALAPVVARAAAAAIPEPADVARGATVLVDGTLALTWDWAHRDDLYSGKHRDTGFNLQVAATLAGDLVAVGLPSPGSWHDAHAWRECGLPERLTGLDLLADLGYLGCGMTCPTRTPPGGQLSADRSRANTDLSRLRAAVERAIAHLKNWKILATRYRGPLETFPAILATIVALTFFKLRYRDL